ncbi:MAG TPA: TolC family protein [Elusimicrobiales bacterium]|nr:TolC family protein [Elusimicrobiales bacterium]
MRKLSQALFLAAYLLPLPAALAAGPEELSWEDCVREALAANPALKAKRLSVEQNRYLYLAGYNAYLPKVNVSHSVNRSGGDGLSPSNRWNFGLSASEPILDLKAVSSIKSARLNLDQAEAAYRAESASLRQTLFSAFTGLLVAQERVKVQNKIAELREQNARLIKLKYDSGMESRGNMMYAAALHELSRTDAQKAGRALEMARRELLSGLGSAQYRPVAAKAELRTPSLDLKPEEVRAAVENAPQVVSARTGAALARQRSLSARYDLFPTVSANQSLGWSGKTEFPEDRNWSLGLTMSLPLFGSGLTYYPNNTAAAKAALKSAEQSLRDLQISLENGIMSAFYDFQNALDTALANVAVLKANEERYKESQIKYMAGKISFLDLENVEQSLVDNQLNQLQYLQNASVKKIAVENRLGIGLEDRR